jgi:hypothetical protein
MSTPSVFGPIVTQSQVEAAVLATIEKWVDTYLAQLERVLDLTVPTIERPQSYGPSFDLANWEGLNQPAVVIVGDKLPPFDKAGGDRYNALFPFSVGIFVTDQTEQAVRNAASTYVAAVGALLVQNGSLGGIATNTDMLDWDLRLPDPNNRTFALGEIDLHVWVNSILTGTGGPATPDPPTEPEAPISPWPLVETPEITVVGEAP